MCAGVSACWLECRLEIDAYIDGCLDCRFVLMVPERAGAARTAATCGNKAKAGRVRWEEGLLIVVVRVYLVPFERVWAVWERGEGQRPRTQGTGPGG